MRYGLNNKPPYKASLDEIRAYAVETLSAGEEAEVYGDKKKIGAIVILDEDDEVKKEVVDAYAVFESFEKKDRDKNNLQQWLRKDGSVICDVIAVDPEEESTYMIQTGPSRVTGEPSKEYTYRTQQRALMSGYDMIMSWPYKEDDLLYMGVFSFPERICTGYILRPEKSMAIYGDDMDWKVLRKNGTIGKKYAPRDPLIGPRTDEWESVIDGTFPERYMERVEKMKAKKEMRREIAETGQMMSKEEAEANLTDSERFKKDNPRKDVNKHAQKAYRGLLARGYTRDEYAMAKSVMSMFIARPVALREKYGLAPDETVAYDWENSYEDDLAMVIEFLREHRTSCDSGTRRNMKVLEGIVIQMESEGLRPAGLSKKKRSVDEIVPSDEELKKSAGRLMKKLCKKYSQSEINAAMAILKGRITQDIMTLKDGKKVEDLHDWTQVGKDIEDIIKGMRSGSIAAEPCDPDALEADYEILLKEIEMGMNDMSVKKAEELTKKALELEKPVDRAQLEETLKDELDGIKEMQARRPAALMRGELADSLYELNQISHLYFQAQEMHTLFMDIAEIGGDMGLTEAQARELTELQSKVTDRLAEIYDAKTEWLITGKED